MFHHENIADAPYIVIAYYHLNPIDDPVQEMTLMKKEMEQYDVTCRVYISKDGVNAQMCFSREDLDTFISWIESRSYYKGVHLKFQGADRQVFPRVTIKHKPLVAFGRTVPLEKRGTHLSPSEWKKMLEEEQDALLIDVRNMYEWEVGHFTNAEPVPYDTFREFQLYAQQLKEKIDKNPKKVMMYCTGGIRCEYFSALLKNEGIEEVYQLEGGVINYSEKEGAEKWRGSLFVFDDRLTIPVGEGSDETIGVCTGCSTKIDRFYNCANMDCNALFLSCESCLEKRLGCCQESCSEAPRRRPFQFAHTPFRRWYTYAKTKQELLELHAKKGNTTMSSRE